LGEKKSAILVEFTPEEANELRAAYRDTGAPEGFVSLKHMIHQAAMIYVAGLQDKHNAGQPFARPGEVVKLRRGQRTLEEEGRM
jgi:hypothetical protein